MSRILIIDDDRMLCDVLFLHLTRMQYEVACAYTLEEGFKKLSATDYDVVFLDVRLPDGNGLDALPKIIRAPSSPEVIIFTAEGDPDGAELAIKSGAWDYIEKPLRFRDMMLPLIRALQYRVQKRKTQPKTALKRMGIIGSSPQLEKCIDLLAEAASSRENVLILGETGTGKELFARAIHENSSRSGQKYVVLDCAAMPRTLVESMLFGHEKGAFTGADKSKEGLIKQADDGTLFLDEVGELPLSIQKSFLRVLQERSFRPVGGQNEIKSDFRLLAATNRDLEKMAKEGRFRSDLLFRLKSLVIQLPPLRERSQDIKEITINWLHKLSQRSGGGIKGLSPEFFEALMRYHWPGNVRELLNSLERALVSSKDEPVLYPKHLPTNMRVHLTRTSVMKETGVRGAAKKKIEPQEALEPFKDYREAAVSESERDYLERLMSHTKGNVKEACSISGLSQSRLYHLLKKHQITRS